jgi:hypothetical protein
MARIELKNCDVYLKDGLSGTALSAKKTNEKQTVTIGGTPTGGTFTLTFGGNTTNLILFDASAAQVQSSLEALPSIGEGNVSVTKLSWVYTVEFIGALSEAHQTDMTKDATQLTPSGTVTVAETVAGGDGTGPTQTDTSLTISTVSLNTAVTTKVPVGARFTIAGETDADQVHVVTARTPASTGPTTSITFTPALGAGSYSTGATLTFDKQSIEIKVGEGDAKWSEANQYKYDLDRGHLDAVRAGDDVPMDVSLNCTFDQIKSGTGEVITPVEALKGIDAAAEWVSSSSDLCEPYSVDLVIIDTRPCGAVNSRSYTFPDFRSEKRDFDIKAATIAVSGKCNAVEPIIEVLS